MTKYELLQEVKVQQKTWAKEIKKLKSTRKTDKRDGRSLWKIELDIVRLKYKFRHHHIVYCEIRGRTREEIEQPRDDNKASQREIDRIKKEWMEKIDADVHIDKT